MSSPPTRFPGGVSLISDGALRNFPYANFVKDWIFKLDDFFVYNAAEWTVTETQAGATQAVTDAHGGIMLLTNSAADNDVNQLQALNECFKLVAGKKTMFETRFKVNDAIQCDIFMGLIVKDTDLVGGVVDGLYFRKDDGDANIDLVSLKNSAGSTSTAIATMVNDTYVTLGFYFNGYDLRGYVNHVQKTFIGRSSLVFVDDEELAVTLSLTNGEAVAKTMSIDYYVVAQELTR